MSTGYVLQKVPVPTPHVAGQTMLTGPLNSKLANGIASGTMIQSCHALAGASAYEGQLGTDPNNEASYTFKQVASGCKHITHTGVPPGVVMYGRIRGIGPNGPGAWSDVAQHRSM